jgi:hypothetical protein
MRDIASNIGPAQSLRPQVVTAAVNGTGVDILGFASAALILDAGTMTGTTPSETIKWQDSDDNSTFADIATTDLVGGLSGTITLDTTNHQSIIKRGYTGGKRYVRGIVSAVAGTTPSCPLSLQVTRGHASFRPIP